ncbi:MULTISPECIES: M14 family zinc carboxypeptidase [Metabacillus]|nr:MULTISPECIES: M14 family zinc carboxypeptidase [Metabacillus]QNF28201.1 carboxypeptidase [Metabacillus sp. KUDC1714]
MIKRIFTLFLVFFLWISHAHASTTEMYTYDRMKDQINSLAKTYQLELKTIGQSEFGRDLLAVKVGNGSNSILITGSHHGREWLTTHVIMNMIEQYASAYEENQSLYGHNLNILDQISIWFVPMVNPDGVTIQQEGIKELPLLLQDIYIDMNKGNEDFSRWKANGLGVDLNRQYPAGWERIEGSQRYAAFSHYKGQKPLEAKETLALSSFTEQVRPLASASYHTSGRLIYWYYFNEIEHLQRDHDLIEQVANKTGYEISYPPANAIGGGYTDWFIQTYKKPALTIELSFPVEETNPPLSVLEEEWQRNKEIGLIMAKYAESEVLR